MNQEIGIVGGSAAGLFVGHLLARSGLRVCLFEGADGFNPNPRTLIVTARMREILGNIGENAVVNEIRQFELFTDGRVARIALRQPDLVVERGKLIQELARAAQAADARVIFGRKFLSLDQRDHALTLTLERTREGGTEEAQFRTVVGADGALSRVAQAAGWPQQPIVPLVQAIVGLPAGMSSHTTRVWFIPEDTPYFYWLIPHSSTQGVVGLVGKDGPKTRHALERFLDKHQLTPVGFQSASIPAYTRWIPVRRQLAGGDVYLVGDAAGHVKVTTVGGVVTGFRGALGVAEAILNGSSRKLRALRRELDLHRLIRQTIHGFTQAHYSRLVDLLDERARRDLEIHTRDEPAQVLWRLCLHQPRLLLLGLRAFLWGGGSAGQGSPTP